MPNLFSVPIFFLVFRETLEAAIVISVLLGLAEQIVHESVAAAAANPVPHPEKHDGHGDTPDEKNEEAVASQNESKPIEEKAFIRKLRIQIFAGAGLGLLLALGIGAAFIAVWFTKASDLWEKSEELWEGIFNLIASLIIFVMGITMLKMDRGRVPPSPEQVKPSKCRFSQRQVEGEAFAGEVKTGKWVLFVLPFITVLREGMEAVVFVGGVSLGQPATSIPIAAIVGIIAGLVVGFVIYSFASRTTLRIFLIVMTNFLLLIGAGLFSKAVGNFERHAFNKLLGGEAGEGQGDGPGTYKVQGNVWHLNCCNPENKTDDQGWSIFAGIFGWNNDATLGTILSYVFYWIAVMVTLVYMKFKEVRFQPAA
ncbi:hypothetical protein NMY22_g15746 [Coprinellus aureogranulatus]|nr:hypothetical protein NMY22_g15746 [Coprinellus aureogranulatus]